VDTYFLKQKTPGEITSLISRRLRVIRKRRKLSQQELSKKSGVSLGSVKRFETTGQISLTSLTKIAIALECENELLELFEAPPYQSIQEIVDGQD